MTDSTLEQGEAIQKNEWSARRWAKRAAAVTFCLSLLVTLGVVFTRVIAARVPEQRATLEKLITERTGLDVRFDNVHFAWDLDGASAVFTRVELTDPKAGRVHVTAPELRVEFDTWDFLRHHQFSLGHVTLASPDIEITGDPEESLVSTITPRGAAPAAGAHADNDEAAVVRRYLGWAGLMPTGRIEVEGARVHLKRRGDSAPRHSFTLSQAVVSRGGSGFSAYGTMLLSQDIGQSLFVSTRLDGVGDAARVSGELRVIARRVFLDRLGVQGLAGRGTIDARLELREGRVDSGTWQASARELAFNGEAGARFDHLAVNGKLSRAGADVLLDFSDLQLTRGARLERAPSLNARLEFAPRTLRIARTQVRAERLPFMAAEFFAGFLAPHAAQAMPAVPGGWIPTAGELHDLQFDSGQRFSEQGLRSAEAWSLKARIDGANLWRESDRASVAQIAAQLDYDAQGVTLEFSTDKPASVRIAAAPAPRALVLDGKLSLSSGDAPAWRFAGFSVASGDSTVGVDGNWDPAARRPEPLQLTLAGVDRALLQEVWPLLAADSPPPKSFVQVAEGTISQGTLELAPDADGGINWVRSRGTLALAGLATSGTDTPRLAEGRGTLSFSRGGAQLVLDAGNVDDLALTSARMDWPRGGAPRLRASLDGRLESPLLRDALAAQGLDRLSGDVTLEAEARGENELRDPALWRVNARVNRATVPLAGGLPAVEKLSGTLRYSARQLRALELSGSWLGGPVEIESRRSGGRGNSFAMSGVADAAPLLGLLGGAEAAGRVSGQLAWSGSAVPEKGAGSWQIMLNSSLSGVESRLPEPFDKTRGRAIPVAAELHIDADGIREFSVESGRSLSVNGQVQNGVTRVKFEVQGISGELQRAANSARRPELRIETLDLRRATAVLAAAGAMLPSEGDLAINIEDLRYAARSLGPLQASLSREDAVLDFSLDSPGIALHQLAAHGRCGADGRCRVDFTANTEHLAALLQGERLPAEWPAEKLHAAGSLDWPIDSADLSHSMAGTFDLTTQGDDDTHQLTARATVSDGQILLADVQGSGPSADEVFRGSGRIGLVDRDYDLTVDYERMALAATAMPTPARARLARAWSAVRGSVARRGWTEVPESRRVQWHGTWDSAR